MIKDIMRDQQEIDRQIYRQKSMVECGVTRDEKIRKPFWIKNYSKTPCSLTSYPMLVDTM